MNFMITYNKNRINIITASCSKRDGWKDSKQMFEFLPQRIPENIQNSACVWVQYVKYINVLVDGDS